MSPSSGYNLMTDMSDVLYRSRRRTAQLRRDELFSLRFRNIVKILGSCSGTILNA